MRPAGAYALGALWPYLSTTIKDKVEANKRRPSGRPCRIGSRWGHQDSSDPRSSGAGTTWGNPGAKSPHPKMPLPGTGTGAQQGVLHFPPRPPPLCPSGFLAGREPAWPDLASRLIQLSGDVERNPGPTLRLLQLNICGWRKHQPALERLLQEEKIDVAVLQETKLTASTRTPKVPGFTILRQDRTIHRVGNRPDQVGPPQGGLAILVRKGLSHQPHPLPANPAGAAVERLAVKIFHSPAEVFTVCNIYRPPARAAADD